MRFQLHLYVLAAALVFSSPAPALEIIGLSVTPHSQSPNLRYRRASDPELGARVELFLRNDGSESLGVTPDLVSRFDGKIPSEWLALGDWAWHDTPSARTNSRFALPPGALTVWAFNSRRATWGANTRHEVEIRAQNWSGRIPFVLEAPEAWISAVTFLGTNDSVRPSRVVIHLANTTRQPLLMRACRLWLPSSPSEFLILRPHAWLTNFLSFPARGGIPAGEKGGWVAETGPLPLSYGAIEVQTADPNGQVASLWAHVRIKRERFDISGGWVSEGSGRTNPLTTEPFLKTLKRMHIDTAHIGDVPGYTDNDELYTRYPLRLFNRLQPIERYDTDALLPRIHAVEFLGEPQYGGGRPVPPQEVWRAFLPYHSSRLATSLTHSEERVWRDYAGLSDYPHYDAYRVSAPAADAWGSYDRWGGERLRWGAPLETIGDLTRSLRDLNRPRPIAYWSQGAHHDWNSRTRRGSPTPDELRAQAYHALSSRITSLYWFNLSLKSLLKFRDLIEPITRVDREIRLMADLLLEGDAFEYRRATRDGKPDWDLASVTGPNGGVLFAHDLAYLPDPAEKVFKFAPRAGVFEFRLPAYLAQPAEVFRIDGAGIHEVDFARRDGRLEIRDRVDVAGLYVVGAQSGVRARLQKEYDDLLASERALRFDPAAGDADFETLRQLAPASGPAR